ncbi:MAG: acyl-CoA dehydrogenase family protein, partial [Bacteroidota bacterium]
MATQYIDMETLRFLLYDVHEVDQLLSTERFKAYDKEALDMLLDSVKDLSDKEMFPYIKEMDEQPAVFKDGRISIHPQFEKALKMGGEMGLISATFDEEDGGMQLPTSITNAAYLIMEAANNHIPGYYGLTAGAANLIRVFGSQALKDIYLDKMSSMEWGGTMCLTEPQAGSSLSDIVTSAEPREDGTYKIEGQKIFISGGDHQFADNFVHLVLARIKGAPAGTKGISLFVVPRSRLEADGLTYNHVATLGEFNKMGQKSYCTTHLGFSDGGDSIGWLVGEANQGLRYMFQMMNEARIATGRMGTGIASAAYHASLEYAKERPQGRKLGSDGSKNVNEEQTLIINHPDVKRMLLLQKAFVEACMSLITEASNLVDKESVSDGEKKEYYHLMLELLTPIVKTYPAEKGKEAIDNGVQVLGGYGYTTDFILQQYYRDVRIISIYEGTTGIQSLDLLGRKAMMKNGAVLQDLAK